jgi:hypothetical protein
MRNGCRYCDLKGLIKPIDVKTQNKVGNGSGHQKNPPVRKKDNVPGEKAGKNLKKARYNPIVLINKLLH